MRRKKILLVDDSSTTLMMEQMVLRGQAYQIVTAKTGGRRWRPPPANVPT